MTNRSINRQPRKKRPIALNRRQAASTIEAILDQCQKYKEWFVFERAGLDFYIFNGAGRILVNMAACEDAQRQARALGVGAKEVPSGWWEANEWEV